MQHHNTTNSNDIELVLGSCGGVGHGLVATHAAPNLPKKGLEMARCSFLIALGSCIDRSPIGWIKAKNTMQYLASCATWMDAFSRLPQQTIRCHSG
ncbi:hypothetical protein TWF217_002273 [Orbilia oligospora]|nr:hypothetical protein TWF751_005327 [Orbilia oligospora]KAF3265733.1 hypothetical protein TWF217_002273 [Orbilia oligospora]